MNPLLRISLTLLLLFGTFSLQAQKEHEVKEGETLFSISQKYEVSVDSIRKSNELEGKEIQVGQTLEIPLKSKKSPQQDTIEHKVKEGETLYSICQHYQADIDLVTRLNPDARKSIEPGQILRIPVGSDPEAKKGRFPFDSSKAGYHYHKVQKGETLFSMSQRYGVPIDTIRKENSHLEKEPEVGQLLRIPKSLKGQGKVEDPLKLPDHMERQGYRVIDVQRGETLYSIARRNGMTLDELMRENEHLEGELQVGQELRIPEREGGRTPRSLRDTIIFHVVDEGESIRSIATLYGTDPILIILANELFFRDIRPGEILIVPIPADRRGIPSPETEMKEQYRVTLLLPLYLKENDSILSDPPSNEAPELYGPSNYALDFYEGFLLAADSVATKSGISFDLHTISTRKGHKKLGESLQEKKIRKSDLVVGPFYKSNLKKTAEVLKESGVHHVCPVDHTNKVLLSHPSISKAIPSDVTLIKELAQHVAKTHSDNNVILMDSGKLQDDRRESIFQRSFDRELAKSRERYRDSIPKATIDEDTARFQKLKKLLKKDTLNVICVPSGEKVVASRLMTRLSKLNDDVRDGNYPIRVYASEDWKNFETIDIEYKQRFQLSIVTARHIQHDSVPTERFYRAFRARHNTDPGNYGFLGYDIGLYYLNGLAQYGTGFSNSFDRLETPTLHMGFDLFRTGVRSGFENRHAYIIRYTEDDRIERQQAR